MNRIFLIEDHDEVLKIWRREKIKGLDLVHIDAHIDFGFHPAKPLKQIVNEARSVKELKKSLEYSLAFMHYEKDFDKQTNIGNYICPAMEEGMVNNFYWIVPGGLKEFKAAAKLIKNTLRNLLVASGEAPRGKTRGNLLRRSSLGYAGRVFAEPCDLSGEALAKTEAKDAKEGIISAEIMGRDFIVCTLESLPVLRRKVRLDIDTDFLVIDSLLHAENTQDIGKRKPWIQPQELVAILKEKIRNPHITTIAYSVNGGYTPMKYKYFGDQIAYHLAPGEFRARFARSYRAAQCFSLFSSTGKNEYYRKAVELDPAYRAADNNYGPLYFALRKFSPARKEFLRVLRVDRRNPACLLGLGNGALERNDLETAKKYFVAALKSGNNEAPRCKQRGVLAEFRQSQPAFALPSFGEVRLAIHPRGKPRGILAKANKLFNNEKKQSLLGLAEAEFGLKNFGRAKDLLSRYQKLEPLQPRSYYLAGRIFEKEKDFERSAICYKDAIRLGFGGLAPVSRLLKISCHLKGKDAIMPYLIRKYKEFKKGFIRTKKLSLKKRKTVKGLRKTEEEIAAVGKKLEKIRVG